MARHDAKGRSRTGPPFVMLRYDILDSDAWRSLNPAARAIYVQIARRYSGQNNGFLGASVDNLAAECHVAPNTVTAALKRLIEVGLILRTREANFSCKVRLAAEYALTCYPDDRNGHKATNAFKKWSGKTAGGPPVGLNQVEGKQDFIREELIEQSGMASTALVG